MSGVTIQLPVPRPAAHQTGPAGGRGRRPSPLAVTGLVLVLCEFAAAAAGADLPALTLAAIVLGPGLALSGALPATARRSASAAAAAAPALGFAAASVALITLASAGIELSGLAVRLTIGVIVLSGLVFLPSEIDTPDRGELLAALGVVAAVALGALVGLRVLDGFPVPGNDWAKYVLYADEVRGAGSLLLENPLWMLGVPFREDPGVPALYGAYLRLGGQPAVAVAHGIVVLAALATASVYAFVRSFWGTGPGVTAAALWAALPLNATILGWHGLANVAALALVPLVLLYAAALLRGQLDGRSACGAGLVLVALAATHRLSLLVGLAAVAGVVAVALLARRRREMVRPALATTAAAAVLSPGVLYDLLERNRTFGGTQDWRAYLASKLDVELLARDLTIPFSLAAVAAVAMALRRVRQDRALVPVLCLLGAAAALAVAWLVHLPLHYTRMAYYLPLALVPLVAVAVWRLRRPRWAAAVAATALVAWLAGVSFARADNVERLYGFANPASLRGLDAVAERLQPGEVVVTDRCWSFLATWLLHTPTLPALDPSDIQPKAELRFARQARSILRGTPEGRSLARRLGVRFVLVDPGCSDSAGRPSKPPRVGAPLFVSRRLVVLGLRGGR
jgi:hypothetical protein